MTLTNSKKPVVSGAFTEHGVGRMVEMMQLFRADRADLIARPMSIFTITATGNFRYSEDSCQNLIDCVEAGVPVEIVPVTLMGLIAPVTTVGATVFHTIDVLAGITMAQVIKPGAPVLVNTVHLAVGVLAVPATDIARRHIGKPIPNAALLGGFAALSPMVGIDAVEAALRERFSGRLADGNVAAAREAHAFVTDELREPANA